MYMNPGPDQTPYTALVGIVDRLLEDCEDDVVCLATRLGGLEENVRNELLVSDLLNAWQVFWFCFRTDPGILLREQLDLEPASALPGGIRLCTIDLLEVFFAIRDGQPWVVVWDGEKAVSSYSGRNAYTDALAYCSNLQP
jgi:hypothetical protein